MGLNILIVGSLSRSLSQWPRCVFEQIRTPRPRLCITDYYYLQRITRSHELDFVFGCLHAAYFVVFIKKLEGFFYFFFFLIIPTVVTLPSVRNYGRSKKTEASCTCSCICSCTCSERSALRQSPVTVVVRDIQGSNKIGQVRSDRKMSRFY